MPHILITGQTETGKTTLACRMSNEYRRQGVEVLVLDPMRDRRWDAAMVTRHPEYFMTIVQHPETESCALFIDESGEQIGQYNSEMFFLATRARHKGHNSHFLTQRPSQLSPTVRDQCKWLYCFCVSAKDGAKLSEEFNAPELKNANSLKPGEYYRCSRFTPVEKYSLW